MRLFSLVIVLTVFSTVRSQSPTVRPPLTTISDWGQRSIFITDEFWNRVKGQIIKQIGPAETDSVKRYCEQPAWPLQFKFVTRPYKDSTQKRAYRPLDNYEKELKIEKLNSLKMYKIATFRNTIEGRFDEEYVVLRVPYTENVSWHKNVKWNVIYFIAPKDAVKEIEN